MAGNGVATADFTQQSLIDEVLGNRNGSSVRQPVTDLAQQLLGIGAIADKFAETDDTAAALGGRLDADEAAITLLQAASGYQTILKATWADLLTVSGAFDGQAAEVDNGDSGTHLAASATGYDGASVSNSGRYTWVAAWTRWKRVSSTIRSDTSVFFGTAGGTANAIALSAPLAPNPTNGLRIAFFATATNTGATTLSLNGGTAFPIYAAGTNGALVPNDITTGYYYEAAFNGAGNVWRLKAHQQDRKKLQAIYALASAVGGTANAITVTADLPRVDGTLLYFTPALANTASATLSLNGATASTIKGRGANLAAGDLDPSRGVLVRYNVAAGNVWEMIADGAKAAEIIALQARMTAVENATAALALNDDLSAITPQLVSVPYGAFSWASGVRSQTPNRIVCTCVGPSIGNGAGSSDGSVYAPNALFVAKLAAAFGTYGDFTFVNDNHSVGGQVLSQFMAQFIASTEATKHFLLVIPGMNDWFPGGMQCGQGFAAQAGYVDALIDAARAAGAIPVVATSPHPHPTRSPAWGIPTDTPMVWPYRTYDVTTTHACSVSAQTITAALFANTTFGGQILNVGDTLYIHSGPNAGHHTITAISVDRTVVTVAGTILADDSSSTQITHVQQDPEQVMWPPRSQVWQTRDWTGGGVASVGNLPFWIGNNMVRDRCRRKGSILLDAERFFFRGGVEVHGYDALFDSPNYNHPNDLGYTVSYGAAADALVRELSVIGIDRLIAA